VTAAVPTVEIAGIERAHADVAASIADLTDEVARRPSRLPGWSVGHVLTHLARNADSVVRRLEGAAAGHVLDQYAGGAEGRARDIEAGSARPAAELVADVLATNHAVEAALAGFPEEGWDRLTRSVSGSEEPVDAVAFSRWREVEVHHVDLGLGYTPAQWPDDLVERWLPHARATFLDTVDQRLLLAWLVGRAPAPQLEPWG
jgi:maleylpyruvate isomerase